MPELAILPTQQQLAGMSQRPILDEILRLPPDERIQLVEDVWESLAASPEGVPVPDWHRQLLDDRLADSSEVAARSWEEVKASARRSTR